MPSPWVELLCLHGYITDSELLRKLTTFPPGTDHSTPESDESRDTVVKQALSSLRLCLGIGDGVLRSQ